MANLDAYPVETLVCGYASGKRDKIHQQDYYQALGSADSAADSTVFVAFMLKAILQTLENASVNASVNASQNASVPIEGMKTPDAIMALVQADASITRQHMAEKIGKDIRTIGRAIKKLQDEGKLQRIGSDKSGYWELL